MKIENIVCVNAQYYHGWNEAEFTCVIDGTSRKLTYTQDRLDDGYGYTIHSDGDDIWGKLTCTEADSLETNLLKAREVKRWVDAINNTSNSEELEELNTEFLYSESDVLHTRRDFKPIVDAFEKRESELKGRENRNEVHG